MLVRAAAPAPPPVAPVIASRLWSFGHSYLAGGGTTHVDRQFVTLLAGALRSDLRDLGVGGAEAANDRSWLGAANGDGGWAWLLQNVGPYRTAAPYTPGLQALPLIVTGLNDLTQHSHDGSGAPRTIFKTALRTHLSRLCAARVFEQDDASIVYGGITWPGIKADIQKNSGLGYLPCPGNTATFTITLPADFEGGTVAIGLTVWPAGDGQITWTGTASQLPATTSLAGLAYAAGGVGIKRNSSNGHVVRVTGLVAADAGKTIIGTYGSGAGTTFATPAAPGAITNVGVAGGTTYTYRRIYRTYNGDTIQSAFTSTTTGNATLSGSNFNQIPAGGAWPSGVEAELIFRTVGGTAQGIIATLTAGPAIVNDTVPGGAVPYTSATVAPLTGGFAVDYWQIESNNPVTRGAICNIATLPAAGLAANSVIAGDFVNYNADIAAVIAEFAANQWLLVDIDTPMGGLAANFAADSVHPNDRGHELIAATIAAAVQSWAAGIATSDQMSQARVSKRVTGRALIVRRYDAAFANDNGADYTLGAAMADIDATNLVVSIDAQVGDDIEVALIGMWSTQNIAAGLDIALVNSAGTLIRYASANAGTPTTPQLFGWPAWYTPGDAAAVLQVLDGSAVITVAPGDLTTVNTVPGVITMRLRGFGNGKVLFGGGGSSSPPLAMHVKNLGSRNTPGFNAS